MTAPAAVAELGTRNADLTQQEIPRAAMDEFSERGLGGARIDSIAERAGVNKRLIYCYFGGKDELLLAVLEQTYADIREAERELHPCSDSSRSWRPPWIDRNITGPAGAIRRARPRRARQGERLGRARLPALKHVG